MFVSKPASASLTALLFLVMAVAANGSEWVVSKVTQPAMFTTDSETWTELEQGMAIPDEAWINTGRRGRLLLRRENEMILFKPDTMVSIVTRQSGGRKTDIGQQYGGLLLDVETRATAHTTVHTPFLTAVVKGTRFEVAVGDAGASLNVERGTVETTDIGRSERVDVRSGQAVEIALGSSSPLTVTGPGAKAPVVRVKDVRTVVSLTAAQKQAVAETIAADEQVTAFGMTRAEADEIVATAAAKSNGAGNRSFRNNANDDDNAWRASYSTKTTSAATEGSGKKKSNNKNKATNKNKAKSKDKTKNKKKNKNNNKNSNKDGGETSNSEETTEGDGTSDEDGTTDSGEGTPDANGNIGTGNIGHDNVGNNNQGDRNEGNGNVGHDNVGNNNKGDRNKGNNNVGHDNVGNGNKGDRNKGNNNTGNDHVGNNKKS